MVFPQVFVAGNVFGSSKEKEGELDLEDIWNQTCTNRPVRCAVLAYRTVTSTMSSSTPGQSSAPSSDFKSILDAALSEYVKKTGKPLLDDPLAANLQGCESVRESTEAIIAILRGQVEAFQQFRDGDMRWLDPTLNALNTFSAVLDTVGSSVGLVRQ